MNRILKKELSVSNMISALFAKSILAAVSLFFICLQIAGCGSNTETKQASDQWESLLAAVKTGDASAANRLFTEESLPYFNLDSTLTADYTASQFKIIKTEANKDNIRMQILQERGGKETALFKYLVKRQDKYMFQYPFLIFAADWSVKESQNFTVHSETFAVKHIYGDSTTEIGAYDPEVLEQYLIQVKALTGSDYTGKIDYYYCRDSSHVGLLSGENTMRWKTIGPCVISSKKYDFAEITRVVTRDIPRPCTILRYGILGYGESERVRADTAFAENDNITIARHTIRLKEFSLAAIADSCALSDTVAWKYDMFFIAGALVTDLVDEYGVEKFRQLYLNSPTTEALQEQIKKIYGKDLNRFENQLLREYEPYYKRLQELQQEMEKISLH